MKDQEAILVVDEEPGLTKTLSEFLTGEGHTVAVAHTGAAALRRIREGGIGLVLLDLRLPDTNGRDVMQEARRDPAAPEFIIVAGHATLDAAREAVEGSAAGYLPKPVDLHRLGVVVRRVFERRRLLRENWGLQQELGDRLAESETLAAIAAAVSSTLDTREALRTISRALARLLGAETAAAYLLDPATGELVPTAAYHVPKEHLATLATTGLPLREQGFYLPLWGERRPVWSDDVARDPRFTHELFRAFAHQSGLLLPLVLDEEVVGAFYLVWWTARRTFSEPELQLLTRVTAQVGLLLRNARLWEQAERNQHRLEVLNEVSRRLAAVHEPEEVLSLIVNEAARLVSAEAAGLRLVEGDDLVVGARTESAAALMTRPRIKTTESLSGRVVSTGTPVVVEDLSQDTVYDPAHKRGAVEHGYRGFIGVPLKSRDRILGTLNVYTKGARHFLPDEIALLAALADQASTAIEKARLFRETEESQQLLARLYQAAIAMQTSWDRDDRLTAFVKAAHEIVGFDRVRVHLTAPDASILELVKSLGEEPDLAFARLPLSPASGPFYEVVQTRRPIAVLSDDDLARVAPIGVEYRTHPIFRSTRFVVAPLVVGERVIGVVSADNKPSRRPISASSIEPFSLLCQDLAIALENARLFEETQTQRVRLAEIFDSTSDGIVLVSSAGEIQAVNRRAGELLGFDAEEAVGVGLRELLAGYRSSVPDYDHAFAALHVLLEDPDRAGEGDLELRRMGRIVHWTGQPTKDAAGRTLGLTLTLRDVTQERQVAQMKTDFVSFVTHQLRTPLAGIKWMLELAQQAPALSDEPASYVQDARQAAERLIGLVNDLLDVSRLESGKLKIAPQAIDVGELTRSVLDDLVTLVREKGHRLSVEGADSVPTVTADPQLLRQVVLNLTSNAIKYTPPGGAVVIRMELENGAVRWAIEDSGIGIPRASQARLFEKFFRADNVQMVETEGTGLGLYIVRLILEKFSGQVWCESEEGKGSTFIFTLPVSERGR